jgi:hypothetical protein
MAKQGEWVRIHSVVLQPKERAPQVPEDTARQPLELWVKGFLLQDAQPGDRVQVRTRTGRVAEGTLLEDGLDYTHSFGHFVPELMQIDAQVRGRLFGGDINEG